MSDHSAEGQLRRELDVILSRLERHERTAQADARADDGRLVGDMFADAQVIASRNLDALGYERLSRRARELMNALERVRDGSYGTCDECGGAIPAARAAGRHDVRAVSGARREHPDAVRAGGVDRTATEAAAEERPAGRSEDLIPQE